MAEQATPAPLAAVAAQATETAPAVAEEATPPAAVATASTAVPSAAAAPRQGAPIALKAAKLAAPDAASVASATSPVASPTTSRTRGKFKTAVEVAWARRAMVAERTVAVLYELARTRHNYSGGSGGGGAWRRRRGGGGGGSGSGHVDQLLTLQRFLQEDNATGQILALQARWSACHEHLDHWLQPCMWPSVALPLPEDSSSFGFWLKQNGPWTVDDRSERVEHPEMQ